MISSTDFKRGLVIEIDGNIYRILEYQTSKYAQRQATVRLKLKDLRHGHTIERTVVSDDRFPQVQLDYHTTQFLYQDGNLYTFMDTNTYEQFTLDSDILGDIVSYLTEGMTVELALYEGEPITVEAPITVDLKVTDTAPGVRGDTAQGGTKPATLETGLVVQVPLFVNTGEVVRVDTRTGLYVTRVS